MEAYRPTRTGKAHETELRRPKSRELFALLTGVVLDQVLQGREGVGGGDVVSAFIQAADLVVLHHVPLALSVISDRQREGSWRGQQRGCVSVYS